MKKFGFIVIIVILLFPAQVMARWTVTHLSPGNLDYPSKSFNIQIETNDSIICFTVKISAKEKQPFPAKSGTLLRVSKYIPGHGTEQIAICPIMYEEEEDLRIFRFDVSTNYLANSTFSYSEPYEGKMSRFGGHMYAFQLDDFMKEKTLPNKNEIRTSNKSLQNTFILNITKSMIAISEKGTNSWKYIEYNEQENKVFLKLIPEEVLIQLKL